MKMCSWQAVLVITSILNIDVDQKCSFLKKYTLVLGVSGTQCTQIASDWPETVGGKLLNHLISETTLGFLQEETGAKKKSVRYRSRSTTSSFFCIFLSDVSRIQSTKLLSSLLLDLNRSLSGSGSQLTTILINELAANWTTIRPFKH